MQLMPGTATFVNNRFGTDFDVNKLPNRSYVTNVTALTTACVCLTY
jgi:hypothetical protein